MVADDSGATEWYVDGNPRWPYDKWMRTYFLKPLGYSFVHQAHDRTLEQLREDMVRPARSRTWLLPAVDRIEEAGVQRLFELVECVSTCERAERFMEETGIDRDHLEPLLDFAKRFLIPSPVQLRQLFDTSDEVLFGYFERLKQHRVANSYVLLERGRTRAGRQALAEQTGVPEPAILDFVHRADITRMAFVSGRMVKQLWTLGYTSLEQVRNADPGQYYERVKEYYADQGTSKPFDLTPDAARGLIDGARRLPTVIEE